MSYSIVYTSDDKRPVSKHKSFIIIIFLLTAAFLGLIFQNSTIRDHAIPVFREEVCAAFSNMLYDIKNGVPVGEAMVAFGQEIVFT